MITLWTSNSWPTVQLCLWCLLFYTEFDFFFQTSGFTYLLDLFWRTFHLPQKFQQSSDMSLLSADVRTLVIFDKAITPLVDVLLPQVRQHESPLIVPGHRFWISTASIIHRWCLFSLEWMILAFSQFMIWFSHLQWSVMADLTFYCCALSFIALVCHLSVCGSHSFLCSFFHMLKVLPVSPIFRFYCMIDIGFHK